MEYSLVPGAETSQNYCFRGGRHKHTFSFHSEKKGISDPGNLGNAALIQPLRKGVLPHSLFQWVANSEPVAPLGQFSGPFVFFREDREAPG